MSKFCKKVWLVEIPPKHSVMTLNSRCKFWTPTRSFTMHIKFELLMHTPSFFFNSFDFKFIATIETIFIESYCFWYCRNWIGFVFQHARRVYWKNTCHGWIRISRAKIQTTLSFFTKHSSPRANSTPPYS